MGKRTAAVLAVGALMLAACGDTDTSDLDAQIADLTENVTSLDEDLANAVEERDRGLLIIEGLRDDREEADERRAAAIDERDAAIAERDTATEERDAALAEVDDIRLRFDAEIQAAIAGAQEQALIVACDLAGKHFESGAPKPDPQDAIDVVLDGLPEGATIDSAVVQVRIDECTAAAQQQAAVAAMTQPKGDGFWTVGVEIAAGRWRSTGTADDCYWAITPDGNPDDILDNHFGNAGGTVTLRAGQEFETDDCGVWEFLG